MMNTETTEVNEDLSCSYDYTNCPLFMQSLPADFGSHPALAALASLITTDEDEDDQPPLPYVVISAAPSPAVAIPVGGGKASVPKSRTRRRSEPYPKPNAKPKNAKQTTIGEAQLFLSLWKL